MKKFVKVIAVCLSAALLAMALGGCQKAEDKIEDVKNDVVAEFGVLVDEAKTLLTSFEDEAKKLEGDAAAGASEAITNIEGHLSDAKTAFVSEEEKVKEAAADALAKAEAEFAKLQTWADGLGDKAGAELKAALGALEEGINKLKGMV